MRVLPGMRSTFGVPIKLRGAFVHKPTPKKIARAEEKPYSPASISKFQSGEEAP
jgi:hypothetical protein